MDARVLVADQIADEGIAILKGGAVVDVRTDLTPAELLAAIADYEGVIVRSESRVTRAVVEAGGRLRVIARAGVGVDSIDIESATERGIVVVNAPTGNTVSAAELTLALLLAVARHVPAADASLRGGHWNRGDFMGVEVRGKTAGIVGLGQVGSAVARRLRALEMTVIGYDPYVPAERARVLGVDLVELPDLLRRSDFVSLHAALTPETTHLIGPEQLALMKPSARIINAARGGLIDEAALLAALDAGRLGGAALDVFQEEPATESPLARHPNVVVTPHLGALTAEAQERVAVGVAHEVLAILAGRPATSAVNAPFVDPDSLVAVGPYLAVAEMCGTLVTQIAEGQWRSIQIEYRGSIADYDVTALKAAAVAGLLSAISEERVNLVSVNNIIRHRGWQVVEQKTADGGPYTNAIAVRLMTAAGETQVTGTLVHGEPRIVEINGFGVDVARGAHPGHPDGHDHILILHNEDRPGRIGAVGTELGTMGVNISHMDTGRRGEGEAIMVVSIDRALTADEVTRLVAIPGIERATQARV